MENPTRRRVLAAGLTGTALGLIGGRTASAGTPPSEPPTATSPGASPDAPSGTPTDSEPTADEPSTTELPQRPTEADVELLRFAQSAELAAQDLYQEALDAGVDDRFIALMRDNHQSFAQVIAGILGVDAAGQRDDGLYDDLSASFGETDLTAVAALGYDLEATLVATHTALLGALQGIDGAVVIASIITVEAQQGTVLADMAGNGDDLDALFSTTAEALTVPTTAGG